MTPSPSTLAQQTPRPPARASASGPRVGTRRRARPLWMVLPVAALGLMGAHPAPKGTEVTVAAGHNLAEYRTRSATPGYRYVANGLAVHVGGRVRFDNNLTIVAQVDADNGIVTGIEQTTIAQPGQGRQAPSHVGDVLWNGATAMRVGWHDGIIGGEAGVAMVGMPETDQILRPSAMGWVGVPSLVYAWGSTHAGPITRATALNEPFMGLGHRSEHLTLWWGTHVVGRLQNLPWSYAPIPDPLPGASIDPAAVPYIVGATVQVNPGVRLGLEYGTGDGRPEQTIPDSRLSLVVHVEGDDRGMR